jgi:hypothetical protein
VGTLAALAGLVTAALLGGCAPAQKPAPKMGSSLIFPGGGSSSGGGGTVTQGTAAAGSGAWPVALTEDGTNTIVKTADNANKAVRVNVVAGGAAGGTSSSFAAAVPATGTAAGASDGTNMQLPRVFDGDTGAGTQYVSGSILRKSASGGTVEAGTSTDPLRVDPTGTTTQPVSGTVTANQGGTWTVQPGNTANTTAWKVDGSAVTQPVSGTVAVNGALTHNNAAPAATLVGAMPAIANAAAPTFTEGRLVLHSVDLGGSLRTLIMNSTLAATQSGTWTVQPGNTANTTPWLIQGNQGFTNTGAGSVYLNVLPAFTSSGTSSTTTARMTALTLDADNNSLRVTGSGDHDLAATTWDPLLLGGYSSAAAPTDVGGDGRAVRAWFLRNGAQTMQPTLGGVLASTGNGVAGTGVQRVAIASDNTAFSVNAAQSGTWTVQPGNTQNTTEWLTKPTPRTVSSANNTGTCTSVSSSSTTVLASNASRKAYGFKAPSTNTVVVFCKLGATATTGAVPFEAGSSWNQDQGAVYTGVIDCITASSTSSICVYEFN